MKETEEMRGKDLHRNKCQLVTALAHLAQPIAPSEPVMG